jgi:hypothetical protein
MLCVLIVLSLHRESLKLILVDEPLILRWFCHTCMTFHPYTCGLCGCATSVAAALIGYDDVEVAVMTTTRRRRSWLTTFSTPMCNYIGSLLQHHFLYTARLVVTIYDLLLASFLRWHGRSSASIAYLYPRTCHITLCHVIFLHKNNSKN